MYIRVIGESSCGEFGECGQNAPTEVLVNPDCPIRLIYEYIRDVYDIKSDLIVDLCDESGNLVFMFNKEPWMNGLNLFQPLTTYFVVLFDKDEENHVINPVVYLPDYMRKSVSRMNDILTKVKKQLNPGLNSKGSKISKTRSGSSSYAK